MNFSSNSADQVSIRIEEKISHLSDVSSERCIFRVNGQIRSINEKAYEPAMVAIGPYHRGKANLQEMEEHKLRYLQQVLKRREETSVDRYVMAIRELEKRARHCYAETISLDTDEFVEMMLLDGCFIVELFRRFKMKKLREGDDPVFQSAQIRHGLRRDLILLENQLPFFILVQLFIMTAIRSPKDNLIHMALSFLKYIMPNRKLEAHNGITINEVKHLLGLVHDSWCFQFAETRKNVEDKVEQWEFINSATELQEAGVQFKMVERSNLFDIKFTNGVLEIPRLSITVNSEYPLRNLMAYEQFLPDPKYVCDYIVFMDRLSNTWKDVQLLRRSGIIKNWLGDDATIETMFNMMNRHIMITSGRFCYYKVFNDLNKHCRRRQNVWMETLRRNYFNSPWALVSFFTAVILLLLTLTQAAFSVLSVTFK